MRNVVLGQPTPAMDEHRNRVGSRPFRHTQVSELLAALAVSNALVRLRMFEFHYVRRGEKIDPLLGHNVRPDENQGTTQNYQTFEQGILGFTGNLRMLQHVSANPDFYESRTLCTGARSLATTDHESPSSGERNTRPSSVPKAT